VRNIASPDINTDDFSAAVDFLIAQDFVDSDKIGILGICGWGGFAINAAAIDTRIKATATSTMYDMTRVSAKGYNDSVDVAARAKSKEAINAVRTADAKNGAVASLGEKVLPEKSALKGDEPQFLVDYVEFYKTERGFHERSLGSNGAWTTTSALSLINQPILAYSSEISTPVLLVHGENAHSLYFSQDAYKALRGENKELYIVPGAVHTDLYDNLEKIPYDKFEQFFRENLK